MIPASYARKGIDQSGVADDATSVRRQIEHARAYAAGHGWTVRDEYPCARSLIVRSPRSVSPRPPGIGSNSRCPD
jgi:hypothetical protein